jgi:hypothetical protein
MIFFVIASVLATQPLMATGNDVGVWFVRDTEPGTIGPLHQLCQQIDQESYQVILPLAKRPIALAVHEQTVWFVGESEPPILYRARLVKNQSTGDLRTVPLGRATAVASLELRGAIRDLIFIHNEPVLVVKDGGVQCFDIRGEAVTPILIGEEIHVAIQNGALIGAVSHGNDVTMHMFEDGVWKMGGTFEINGNLEDLIVHDGWPLLITTHHDEIEIVGLQQDEQMKIAVFPKLAGRWSIVEGGGLRVLGVERSGTTTAFDVGWPSGKKTETIELTEQYGSIEALELTMLIVTTVIFFVVMMLILSRKPKKLLKN